MFWQIRIPVNPQIFSPWVMLDFVFHPICLFSKIRFSPAISVARSATREWYGMIRNRNHAQWTTLWFWATIPPPIHILHKFDIYCSPWLWYFAPRLPTIRAVPIPTISRSNYLSSSIDICLHLGSAIWDVLHQTHCNPTFLQPHTRPYWDQTKGVWRFASRPSPTSVCIRFATMTFHI